MAAWTGGEFGGEWIHVYLWLSPFAIYLIVNRLHHNTKKKRLKKKSQEQDTANPITLRRKKAKEWEVSIYFSPIQ